MAFQIAYYVYFFSLLFALFCGIFHFKQLDVASKVLFWLVCCAFFNETAAYYFAKKYQSNIALYNIYCFVEFGVICYYFNNVIDIFIRKNIGLYIGVVGNALGIINLLFIQKDNINSYFLLFESLAVIGMSFFAFFRMLLKHDSLHLYKYAHFWFISVLVFFWCTTFLTWGLYYYINIEIQQSAWEINAALLTAGAIMYASLGCIFLLYKKMESINE
jgi:hypothetical protein